MIGTLKNMNRKKSVFHCRLFFRGMCSETSYKPIHYSPCLFRVFGSVPKPRGDGSIRPWWSSHRCRPLAYQRTTIEVESVWGGKFRTRAHLLQHIKFLKKLLKHDWWTKSKKKPFWDTDLYETFFNKVSYLSELLWDFLFHITFYTLVS